MSTQIFYPLKDQNLVVPRYPCGKTGATIDVLLHGTDHATWTLLDDYERHLYKNDGSINCKGCLSKFEKNEILQFLSVSFNKGAQEIKKIGHTMRKVAEQAKALKA